MRIQEKTKFGEYLVADSVEAVVKTAKLVRDVLKTIGLRSWVKTTGGRLHVVPLKPKRTVTECLDFSRGVSEAIAKAASTRVYDGLRQGRARATNPDRLSEKQSDEHVGLRLLVAGPGRGEGVDAAWLG